MMNFECQDDCWTSACLRSKAIIRDKRNYSGFAWETLIYSGCLESAGNAVIAENQIEDREVEF